MGTATIDHSSPPPAPPQPPRPPRPPRRRLLAPLVAGALALAAASTGIAIALAMRPSPAAPGRAAAGSASPTTIATRLAATPTTIANAANIATPTTAGEDRQGSRRGPQAGGTGGDGDRAAVLADGVYDGFVRGVDVGHRTITVDLVQVLSGKAAVDAAKQDGRFADPSRYVRNQSPKLRSLAVAGDVRIHFRGTCEDPPPGSAALSELAKRGARFKDFFYYHFDVRGGLVRTMQEEQAQPAC